MIIVGAGLGGSLMGIYLARSGHNVVVIERRSDLRTSKKSEGRSINMTLSPRGLVPLEKVGLASMMLSYAVPLKGRMIHEEDSALISQKYGKNDHEVLYSIKRTVVNSILLNTLQVHQNVHVLFNEQCISVSKRTNKLVIKNTRTGKLKHLSADVIIRADGSNSIIRKTLNPSDVKEETMEWGYKELVLPNLPNSDDSIQQTSLHIWPRKKGLLLALPNKDQSLTCTLVIPFVGPESFETLNSKNNIRDFIIKYYPDISEHVSTLTKNFLRNPVGSFLTIRTLHWYFKNKIVLLGDAVHAVFPFYGQGMNATFEDCAILSDCMDRYPNDLHSAFKMYQLKRKIHTDMLSCLSRKNFYELRDGVRSLRLLAKREIDISINKIIPTWLPLYTMIAHTSIPYADAVKRAERQDNLGKRLGLDLLIGLKAAQLWMRDVVNKR
ncbi:hypothetical protein A3D77_01845 [Candidatus Gottesmanbacteria bacterium RIFCSPHIGHO2_02_FULL_39_11]|uniref:FAD-binding domain-containing protein n=1 Tax=Candidatus Gottesmanbacteria bacterium RIFCSPHIGHO2_02_FULL_39_11 TaxID=1798382 RepID=A0A1F5ZTG1_9BACT|nr:MAG: hypothetical protein A3D77_01845 [Candidatus Gottesmanbacteria bacterium RIFCSPHIGHO2_02_FULL_39_11]